MLEELRQIIIKNDKSILDLKFGCRFKHGNKNFKIIKCIYRNRIIVETYAIAENDDVVSKFIQPALIIGRPIRLSDVLRAIEKTDSYASIKSGEQFLIYENYKLDHSRNIIDTKWNLEKDNLNNQSQETIDSLHRILNNKEVKKNDKKAPKG